MTQQEQWTLDNVPRAFWDVIEAAHQDPKQFRATVDTLSQERIRELYHQYRGLTLDLFSDEHYEALGGVSEDTAQDIAAWVVMQGEQFYRKVHDDPKSTPPRRMTGKSLASVLVEAHLERFGAWIS